MKINNFKDLKVWQKSHELTLEIHKITEGFPEAEKFGLISQMRRAAVSVSANIAEGFKRRGQRDKVNFYNIAQSSLSELEYYIILIKDLRYTNENNKLILSIEEIGKMLNGLISVISAP